MGKMSLWTTEQLAEYLNCDRRTVYHLTRKQQIPYFKIGKELRFDAEDVILSLKSMDTDEDDWAFYDPNEIDCKGKLSGISA